MAEEIHHPHDLMVRAVLSDLAEAASFLQAHLSEEVSQALNWSTLKLLEGSFVDEDLRGSEADLLYEIEHVLGEESVWVYILLEHQSTPDRWMRFRLLKYCCRIWDMSFRQQPDQHELRAIVPLVFYQGERSWSYSSEFADLFAESVRNWPGVPRFSHGLIDQSGLQPEEVQGEVKAQIMQLVMMAAYHPTLAWMDQVARLLDSLSSLAPSGGINYVRIFVLYVLSTQEPEAARSFREVLLRHAPQVGDDLMTYAQQLLAEGEQKGKVRNQVEVIEGFLREGVEWSVIARATGVNEAQFQTLKQQVADMDK
jgi:predicted transposase/invertase (TIGR01784 family)